MKVKIFLSFVIIYIVWGSTFTAIKVGLDSFPPILLAGMRFVLAGIIFLILSKISDFKNLGFKEIKSEVIVGILLNFGNAGVCWSEKYMSSGVAALIVGAIPILFMLFNWIGFERKVPHISAILAVGLGIVGIGLISLDGESSSDWRVIFVLLLANCAWVLGSLKFKMAKSNMRYYPRAAIQLLSGGLSLFLFSTIFGEKIDWQNVQSSGYLSVAYLAVAGTVIAYTAYSFLLRYVRTELTTTYALVNPLIALVLGVIYLGEPFTAKISVSAAFIIFSVVLTQYGEKLFRTSKLKVQIDKCS